MENKFNDLIIYTNKRLSTTGLTISSYGIAEMKKRWKLPADKGGYSDYWKK